jgi:hypothetical protein
MASTSKYLDEENVLDILDELDECLISGSSDDSDNCEDYVALADAVDEEDSDVEVHSLGDAIAAVLFGRTYTIMYSVNYFLVILLLKTQQ